MQIIVCVRCGGEGMQSFERPDHCRMCDMLLSQRPPRVKTEATYQAAGGLGGDQFGDGVRDYYLQRAREAGVSTDGKFYESRIAKEPGDPEAWVAGPDDVKRVVEARGWGMQGDITVKGREVEPVTTAPMADDIMEGLVERWLEQQFGEDFKEVKGRAVEQARDDVLSTHSIPSHLED